MMIASFLRDRRLWLIGLTALLALLLAFVVVPDAPAIAFVSHAGYWFVLATFILFVRALWQTFAPELRALRWRSIDWPTLGVIALGGTVLLVHEAFGFKIVMDEIMLLGTSMSMHLDRTVLTPVRGNDIQGAFMIIDGMMDKRPLFFPFLASLLHDLTGYRPANLFLLNGVLTFIFLGLVHLVGRMLAGRLAGRLAGWLAVALFSGLPLLAHNATGGGFELLNLLMIVATLLLGARFLQRRDEPSLTAFCFSALLLAQVRYESVIFLLSVTLIVLCVWVWERRPILSWPVIAAPLLMVHYPLQHRIFDLRNSAWELGSKPGNTEVFSLSFVPENLLHAFRFFAARPSDQPNSLVLSALGFIAVPFFVLLVVKRLRTLRTESPISAATCLFALGFAIQFGLMMCYFWGQFDDIVIRRLSLPTHLGLVIAIVAVLSEFPRPAFVRSLLGIAAFFLLASGIPSMSAHAYSQEYLPGRETAWRRQFIAEQPRRDFLVIDNDSILWIAHQVSATPMFQALSPRGREALEFNIRNRTFSDIYVFQRFDIDPQTGKMTPRPDDELGPDFVLETVREERLQTLKLSRLSRLKELRTASGAPARPDPVTRLAPEDRAEIERQRRAYLERFMKMLP